MIINARTYSIYCSLNNFEQLESLNLIEILDLKLLSRLCGFGYGVPGLQQN